MKKNVINGVLFVMIVGAAFLLYNSLNSPIKFSNEVTTRSEAIIQKLKDIRIIERAYKIKYGDYTNNFDELIRFIENDSLIYVVAMGSEDDSVAVAEGLVSSVEVLIPARDTLFSGRTVDFKDLPNVPYTEGKQFKLGTATLTTESGVDVTVFEASILYDEFLFDLDKQSLVNLKDKKETENRYQGIRVGRLDKASNDAGSWEE